MNTDELRRRIEYFRDLGVKELYRRDPAPDGVAPGTEPAPLEAAEAVPAVTIWIRVLDELAAFVVSPE